MDSLTLRWRLRWLQLKHLLEDMMPIKKQEAIIAQKG